MEKGHYGEYTGNARCCKKTKVTSSNYRASERDDAAHISYLKRDIDYDNKHGHSDENMTADEKHISKLAGDMKYDKEHHGSPAKSYKKGASGHNYTYGQYAAHQDQSIVKQNPKHVAAHSGSPAKHQGDGGHKKAFDYGDGKDNDRKKSHMKKVAHNRDGSHSNNIQANTKGGNAAPKMVSPLSHDREDKKEHLHMSIKKKSGKLQPIVDKKTGKRLPQRKNNN